jgi:hypothetical protein
MEEWYKRKR